ncbi:beta-lactamase family protein [Paenibacillus pasadenensis]|uniref:serine hydrolase domain-containing protein n=1 Tax=Paenibacillus pasadenensis TaxID=217090 RepID=UPI00203E849C|nr:serine hydrolase domain-containing protein [Paenibacillus pasadenensis]MCM3746088.1 beta-lactamase family protein [Paenibacillus pasadenensis]
MDILKANPSATFNPLLALTQKTKHELRSSAASLVVIQGDNIVLEWYNGFHHFKKGARPVTADSMFNLYSTRKTYIGLATAIAVTEGRIPLETPVHQVVRDIPRSELGEVTIRDLATKSGAKYFGKDRMEREELAGKVIRAITGKTIAQLLTERLFTPLELNLTEWASSPKKELVCDFQADGHYSSVRIESDEGHDRNLYTSALDLALWGYLHLKKGLIRGERILPDEVFALYAALQSSEDAGKRLFGWYFQEDWYYATGAAGCHCVVYPEYNAVGVRMLNRYTDNYAADQLTFNRTLLDCLKRSSAAGGARG